MRQEYKIKVISIGFFLSSMLFFSCSNDYKDIIDQIDYENYPSQSAENIEIVRSDSGKIILKIFAPILDRYTENKDRDSYDEFPKGIKVYTYVNYPEISSSIICNYARHDVRTNKWEARDNVIAVNEDGDTLKTEQMFWDNQKGNIYSDKHVNIRTENEIIYGTGFTAKQDFSGWKINKVKGTIYLDE